jgi:hypothetical protein
VRLELAGNIGQVAMFDLAIDSKHARMRHSPTARARYFAWISDCR